MMDMPKKKIKKYRIFDEKRYKLYPGSRYGSQDFSVKSDAREAVTNLRKKCNFARIVKSPFGWWVYFRKNPKCKRGR